MYTIKSIRTTTTPNKNEDLYYNAETDSGAKVMLVATVIDLEIYESGTYNYVIGVLKDGKE